VQQKLGLLKQRMSLLIVMEFLSLRLANFSSNRGPSCSQSWTTLVEVAYISECFKVFVFSNI